MKIKTSFWEDATRDTILTLERSQRCWLLEVHVTGEVKFEKWYTPETINRATGEAWDLARVIGLQFNGDLERDE